MTIRMLINATTPDELRIAIVEDGELIDLDIEATETSTIRGNIYKGVVHNVEASLEAAFVDIGQKKQGFLPFSEIAASQYYRKWTQKEAPKITDVVRRGQDIVVQVAKDAVGEKGATLTTYLSLAGRYSVLMPDSDAGGISRKIEDEKVRRRIRTMAQKLTRPEGSGFIVRTAGLHQTRLGIQKDLDKLSARYEKLKKAAEIARAPSVLHGEPGLIARTLRDIFHEGIDEVWIDKPSEFETARGYFKEVMPDYVDRLRRFDNPIPIFAYYHVEEQIEGTFSRRVELPSGGSIVIDQTEALVAIDVNSGRNTSEGGHEDTVFLTNCEAAEEVARQIRLRDMGGIVVVDFIDMEVSKHKREVERILAEAAKDDKARWKISRINAKGLCVFTRQRIRQGMVKAFQRRCSVCDGTGWVRTEESHALSLLRRIEARLAQGGVSEVRVKTHRETAAYILNHKRNELLELERRFSCRVVVEARVDIERAKDEVSFLSKGELLAEITERLPPRERRRLERGVARKRKLKKKKTSELPSKAASSLFEDEREAEPKKAKERKSKRKARNKVETPTAVAEAKPKDPPESRSEARTESRSESRSETPLAAKNGTTFTGRPSPEQLKKLREERAKRRLGPRLKPESRALAVSQPRALVSTEAHQVKAVEAPKAAKAAQPSKIAEPSEVAPASQAAETASPKTPKTALSEPPKRVPRVRSPQVKLNAKKPEAEDAKTLSPVATQEATEREEIRKSLLGRIFGSR